MKQSVGGARGVPSVLGSDTAFDFTATCAVELDVYRRYRPNVLVIGSPDNQRRILAQLISCERTPQVWPLEGSPHRADTVIIWDAANLDAAEQAKVLDWMRASTNAVQLIALSERPLFPLVEQGEFLSDLYYRLNVVVIDCRETR